MQIVLDAERENGWHGAWMARTPHSYEWWYLDVVSDDRQWSLVAIFLLGNPFSSYYSKCKVNQIADPLEHNAIFFALHHRSKLHHYLFVKYPKDKLELSDGSSFIGIGPNSLTSDAAGQLIQVSESNANNRYCRATVRLTPSLRVSGTQLPTSRNEQHWWLPTVPVGRAEVDVQIISRGVSQDVERIRFSGGGYHDHNWGTLPFDAMIESWIWARIDFGSGCAAVVYSIKDRLGDSKTTLLVIENGKVIINDRLARINNIVYFRNKFGKAYPGQYSVTSGKIQIDFVSKERLEDVPFYVRSRHIANLFGLGEKHSGVGFGEFIEPEMMGFGPVGWAMDRRIYDPVSGQ